MKNVKNVAIFLAFILCALSFVGCSVDGSKEKETYNDTVTLLFNALDEGDGVAIYNLFSPAVREHDGDLEDQIEKLLSIYSGPTDEIGWDGLLSGDRSYEYGEEIKSAYAVFPIRSGNVFYWCYLELMYENTYDDRQIGIVQMDFYTADEYCILEYHDNWIIDDSIGLTVHADAAIDDEIRCIGGHPHIYSSLTEPLNIDDIRSFFKTSDSFSEFTERFGSPNAKNIYLCYELYSEDGKNRYLQIGMEKGTIYSADVVDEFGYIETIFSKYDDLQSKN